MLTEVAQEKRVEYGAPDYDGLWKKLIADLFEEFMLFFAPDLYREIDFNKEPDFLQQELFKEIIRGKKGRNVADQIVKVTLKSGEDQWILIHIEVQDKDSSDFSKRMFRYFYRIYDKFDKEVYAIALMTDNKQSVYPTYFSYNYFGTTVNYTYNVYKFHDHSVEELEQSNNPFAAAIIAGKYASKYKKDIEKRSHFKLKLIRQVYKKFLSDDEKSRVYISVLFYFIDYLLQTPQEFDHEVTKIFYEDGGQLMHMEKEELSPTFARVFKVIKERELEKAEKRGLEEGIEQGIEQGIEKGIEKGKTEGNKEAMVSIAIELIKYGFQDEKIAQLTKLALPEIIKLRKTFRD